uniref:PBPe domain-containing protein n=1 Tax=Macrostomum lignano TaxID=282301 RepID=A0A1I8FHB0_9PLAT
GRRNRTAKSSLRWPRLIRVVTIESRPFVQPKTASLATAADDVVSNDTAPSLRRHVACRLKASAWSCWSELPSDTGGRNSSAPAATAEADKWNGMIGELLQDTADVAFAALTINTERSKVVDFTEPFLTFGISIMIKKPRKEKPGIFGFLQPLSQVWPYMLTCGAGVFCFCERGAGDFSLFNSLWFALASIVNQSVDISPRSSGARLVTSVWWFFTLIMIADYTAILAASLTVELLRTPIESWPDLLGRPRDQRHCYPVHARSPQTAQVYASTTAAGVQRVRESNGRYAFLLESKMNEFPHNRDPCDTMMVGQPFGDNGYGVATQRGSPLRELFNDAILQLKGAAGAGRAAYKKWWIEKVKVGVRVRDLEHTWLYTN